jgi:hypothetical protein
MGLELIVDPSASGELPHKTVTVMLWSMGDDPALLDAKVFTNSADLRAWLKATVATHGSENISVRWSKKLKADLTLSGLIAACLDQEAPGQ